MSHPYLSPENILSLGYQPDLMPSTGISYGAYSEKLLNAIELEARTMNMRHDAHNALDGEPVYFSKIVLAPQGARKRPSEVISHPSANSDHLYTFLDGDTPQEIASAKDEREAILEAQGLEKGTGEYKDQLHKLEIMHRADNLAKRVIPGDSPSAIEARAERQNIFEYIVEFWKLSTIQLDVGQNTGAGLNLAPRPFVTPTGELPDSEYQFNEQYDWDTYFQNLALLRAGGKFLALGQLQNQVDVFALIGLIPNALTTKFTDHSQPPMQGLAAKDLLDELGPGEWYGKIMETMEQDLWDNWLDAGSGVKDARQVIVRKTTEVPENGVRDLTNVFQENPLLTRHKNIHGDPYLVGCEDGKDHYEITRFFGEHYLPVQLNAILHGHLEMIQDYYANFITYNPTATPIALHKAEVKAGQYEVLVGEHAEQFRRVFWESEGEWQGYRNYALPGNKFDGKEGRIKFDDLSTEVFALAFGLANEEEALITRNNIINHYGGDQGLSATGKDDRPGKIMFDTLMQQEIEDFQWRKPNCWPPEIEMAATGYDRYGFHAQATDLRSCWVKAQEALFYKTGFFHEKSVFDSSYDHVNPGIYGNIKGGFGWTIGVYLKSLQELAKAGKL